MIETEPTSRSTGGRLVVWLVVWAGLLLLGACAQRDPDAQRAQLDAQRLDAVRRGQIAIRALTIHPGAPYDKDNDQRVDVIPLVFYLFAFLPEPTPVQGDGSLYFELITPDGESIADWTIPRDLADQMVRQLNPGMGYQMELRLPKGTLANHPDLVFGELTCEYRSANGGQPVRSSVAVRLSRH